MIIRTILSDFQKRKDLESKILPNNQAWCQIVVAGDGFSNPMLVTKSRLFCKINRNGLRIYMTFKDDMKFCLNTVMGSCRGGGISPGISRVFLNSVTSCTCLRLQAEPKDLDMLSSLRFRLFVFASVKPKSESCTSSDHV